MFVTVAGPHTGRPGVVGHVQQVVRADGDDARPPLLDGHHQGVLLTGLGLTLGRPVGQLGPLGTAQGGVTAVEFLHPHVAHPDPS